MPVGIKATQIERDEIAVAPPRTFLPRWLRADPKSAMILAGLIVLAIAAAVLMQVRRDHQVTLKAAELRLTDLAWGSSMAVRGVMENTERVLSLAVTATRTETPNAEAALATLTRLEPLIVNIILLGPDGMLRASKTGRAPYPQFFTNQPFYEAFLKNGGTLEKAASMANHVSTRTTQLYDRRRDEMSLDEVERVVI